MASQTKIIENRRKSSYFPPIPQPKKRKMRQQGLFEVTGERRKTKQAKVDTARKLWIPAVNNAGSFGRWEFIETIDP